MKVINKEFKIGEKYKGIISNELFEVADIKRENNQKYVRFKSKDKTVQVDYVHAKYLLLTKIN